MERATRPRWRSSGLPCGERCALMPAYPNFSAAAPKTTNINVGTFIKAISKPG
jgi:hypothetical protein